MFIIPCPCLVIQHLSRKNYLLNTKSTYIMKKHAKSSPPFQKQIPLSLLHTVYILCVIIKFKPLCLQLKFSLDKPQTYCHNIENTFLKTKYPFEML